MEAVRAMKTLVELRAEWLRLGGSAAYWDSSADKGMTVEQGKSVIWYWFFRKGGE